MKSMAINNHTEYTNASVFCSSANAFLKTIGSDSTSIVFLDPPFNLKKLYTSKIPLLDSRSTDQYQSWLQGIITESIRILAPGGALFMYHIPEMALKYGAFMQTHLDFRHWIAISMKNGFARGRKLYPAHYALLYLTKGKPAVFHRPKIEPQLCKTCGGYAKDYGGYKSIIEEKGINLSDIWDDLSPVRHAKYKNRDANELPKKLFERIIAISGEKGKLFVDPFCGSGTGALIALETGMRVKVCDIVKENYEIINNRIKAYFDLKKKE